MKISKILLILIFGCFSTLTKGQSKDSLQVLVKTKIFVKAFIDFDWDTFRNCFSDDATIFFPTWEEGIRKIGRKEFEKTWTAIFPEFIDSTKKFDLKIDPQNMLIQLYNKTAIVTFHLGEKTSFLSRRTLVFVKEKNDWKIIHLHASNIIKPKEK